MSEHPDESQKKTGFRPFVFQTSAEVWRLNQQDLQYFDFNLVEFEVSVKSLVEFAAKSGSLDRRFTPSPTSQQGQEGHALVQAQREKEFKGQYEKEKSLSVAIILPLELSSGVVQPVTLKVRGRADGYLQNEHCVEEIKTFFGAVDDIPDNHSALHWAQLQMYGFMLMQERLGDTPICSPDLQQPTSSAYCHVDGGTDSARGEHTHEASLHEPKDALISLRLLYYQLVESKPYLFEQQYSYAHLYSLVRPWFRAYVEWLVKQHVRKAQRNVQIEALAFPFGRMHASQRNMAERVYKGAKHGVNVLVQAPTGTGKTLGAIFPALKALPHTPADKLFYLTTKGTTKSLAMDAFHRLSQKANSLRVLELTAIEKACLQPDKQCNGDSCPLAQAFYQKLPAAREEAGKRLMLSKPELDAIADTHEICPYYLSLEMARWVDAVVADVNYFFDLHALLAGLTVQFGWQPIVLVDESHNLVDRARSMLSVDMDRDLLLQAKSQAPTSLKKSLDKVNRTWLAEAKLAKHVDAGRSTSPVSLLAAPPEKLNYALHDFVNAYLDVLQNYPDHPIQSGAAQEFFFSALQYLELENLIDDAFLICVQDGKRKAAKLSIKNMVPALWMKSRFALARSSCLFSATLAPFFYYQNMLGLAPEDTFAVELASPFDKSALQVSVAPISTRYQQRAQALPPIANIVLDQITDQPGNAIVFVSSYEFLWQLKQEVMQQLSKRNIEEGTFTLIDQKQGMSEAARAEFLAHFETKQNVLAFAVLGGVFGEGIDLVGERLQGVFVASLGLPQFNAINDCFREHLQQKFSRGYEFTYLYPGLQKVVQAGGRVIRSKSDRGYLWLIDDRFTSAEVQRCLPSYWF